MKTYQAKYNPNDNKGVYAISLVENPAMEGLFIALKEDTKIQFKEVDSEKRILTGLALEPNKPIYRNQNGEEFNIVFSEETIEELAFGFLKNGYQNNSSLEHDQKITGVTFTESWIIEDEKNDKSNALGFSYPKGSWMVTMKVDDDAIWQDFVKTGKVKGFSIDAMLSLEEISFSKKENINTLNMSEHKSIADAITEGFNNFIASFKKPKEEEKVELGEIKSADGQITFMYDGDMPEPGMKVWITAEDGTQVPLPVGEYELEDGRILVVEEEGVIAEIKEAMPEEEEAPAQAPAEMTAKEADATAKAIENAIKSIMIKYSEDMEAKFDTKLSEIKKQYDEKIVELSNQPAATPTKSTPQMAEAKTPTARLLQTIQNLK